MSFVPTDVMWMDQKRSARTPEIGFSNVATFSLFNRMGDEIFLSYLNKKGRDGNFIGKPTSIGDYSFVISV